MLLPSWLISLTSLLLLLIFAGRIVFMCFLVFSVNKSSDCPKKKTPKFVWAFTLKSCEPDSFMHMATNYNEFRILVLVGLRCSESSNLGCLFYLPRMIRFIGKLDSLHRSIKIISLNFRALEFTHQRITIFLCGHQRAIPHPLVQNFPIISILNFLKTMIKTEP